MIKSMEDDHLELQFLSRQLVDVQGIQPRQKIIFEELKEIGEWKDLIIQNLPQIGPQALVIGELADKKLGGGLVLHQVIKHQVAEEMDLLILLKHHLQD